jgi:hypothetical protein
MNVNIEIKNDLLATILARSAETNNSVENLLDELLREALEQPSAPSVDVAEVIQACLEKVRQLEVGEAFTLDDVIPPLAWDSMSTGDRKSFGKRFRKEAQNAGLAEWETRNSANKAIYKRSPCES